MKEQPLLHLSLNPDEIDTLLTILSLVGGDPNLTRRKYAATILDKLHASGFRKYETNDVNEKLNCIEFIELKFPIPKWSVETEVKVMNTDSVWYGKSGKIVEILVKTTVQGKPLDEAVYILKLQDKNYASKTKLVAFPESDLSS